MDPSSMIPLCVSVKYAYIHHDLKSVEHFRTPGPDDSNSWGVKAQNTRCCTSLASGPRNFSRRLLRVRGMFPRWNRYRYSLALPLPDSTSTRMVPMLTITFALTSSFSPIPVPDNCSCREWPEIIFETAVKEEYVSLIKFVFQSLSASPCEPGACIKKRNGRSPLSR